VTSAKVKVKNAYILKDRFSCLSLCHYAPEVIQLLMFYSDGSNIYLEDTWNLAKQEPLHQHKDATAQLRNKSDFFGR